MAAISRMKVGQVLWSLVKRKAGNTTITRTELLKVTIVSLNENGQGGRALLQETGDIQRFGESSASKWRVSKPEPTGTLLGQLDYKR